MVEQEPLAQGATATWVATVAGAVAGRTQEQVELVEQVEPTEEVVEAEVVVRPQVELVV